MNQSIEKQNGSLGMSANMVRMLGPAQAAAVMQAVTASLARQQMAMMMPRDFGDVQAKLLSLCSNPDFARSAVYEKPIGADKKKGLSVRFAEAAMPLLKNLDVVCSQVHDTPEHQTWRISVTDLESNVVASEEVIVPRRMWRKFLKENQRSYDTRRNSFNEEVHLVDATDDDVHTMRLNLCAKMRRNLIIQFIPPEVRKMCLDHAIEISQKKDAEDPDAARKKIVQVFLDYGVTVDDLKDYLGHSAKNISPDELSELRRVFAALREGEVHWSDFVLAKQEQRQNSKAAEKAKKLVTATRAREGRAPAAKPPETKTETKTEGEQLKSEAAAEQQPARARRRRTEAPEQQPEAEQGPQGGGEQSSSDQAGGEPPTT